MLTCIRIFQHHQLTDLLAGYNKLNVVPPEIGQLTALSVLDLRYNTTGVILIGSMQHHIIEGSINLNGPVKRI